MVGQQIYSPQMIVNTQNLEQNIVSNIYLNQMELSFSGVRYHFRVSSIVTSQWKVIQRYFSLFFPSFSNPVLMYIKSKQMFLIRLVQCLHLTLLRLQQFVKKKSYSFQLYQTKVAMSNYIPVTEEQGSQCPFDTIAWWRTVVMAARCRVQQESSNLMLFCNTVAVASYAILQY